MGEFGKSTEFVTETDRGIQEGRALVAEMKRKGMTAMLGWRVDEMVSRGRLTPRDLALLSEVARTACEMAPGPSFAEHIRTQKVNHGPYRRTRRSLAST